VSKVEEQHHYVYRTNREWQAARSFCYAEKNRCAGHTRADARLKKKRLVCMLLNATKHSATHHIIGNNAAGCIPLFAGFTTGALYGDSTYMAANFLSQTYMYIYISVNV